MFAEASPKKLLPSGSSPPEFANLKKDMLGAERKIQLSPTPVFTQRLISSLEPIYPVQEKETEEAQSPFALGGSSIWSGNGRAIFLGIAVGAFLLIGFARIFHWHYDTQAQTMSFSRFVNARTHSLSTSRESSATPAPIFIPFSPDLIHVTAIALGHPRLAVVNGQSVAEGDLVKFRMGTPSVTVSLRVVKIGEGGIDFTDGTQTITARLSIAAKTNP
jgi:hypothetical protein